ncbi:methionine ABC transporter ATP-binding protein [Paenibacillus sp. JX-17]|uniref:Methionine ABC transporter ATP-binding protein n=1 Tax=Paenibacillus lacisoli TaxID=3064525 RepID=A0ABT9CEE2_9BACL|nr:methionine ABC transporter ATP-binding protein [Paenibacillus sp. JX-17]MDO7907639.1 methionine ABC transporter ATP-binding protein [Paenibacillus sp. JX-17]
MIKLHGVSKQYHSSGGSFQAVQDVTLDIQKGEIHGIIGMSGAGKSTLLRIMNVLEKPDQGSVEVDGRELNRLRGRALREARRSIGMIFQHYNLVYNRTVSGNVAIPLELAKAARTERNERVLEVLKFVGLLDKADQYPARLSGGQKQRVAIARALASRPSVLLCDEPTSALDPQTTGEILEVLRHVNRSLGVTIVIVTHDMDVVNRICTRVSVMENGRLISTQPVEVKPNE